MAPHPTRSVVLEMSGRVYASILQRASHYTLTFSTITPFQVSALVDLYSVFCKYSYCNDVMTHFPYSIRTLDTVSSHPWVSPDPTSWPPELTDVELDLKVDDSLLLIRIWTSSIAKFKLIIFFDWMSRWYERIHLLNEKYVTYENAQQTTWH